MSSILGIWFESPRRLLMTWEPRRSCAHGQPLYYATNVDIARVTHTGDGGTAQWPDCIMVGYVVLEVEEQRGRLGGGVSDLSSGLAGPTGTTEQGSLKWASSSQSHRLAQGRSLSNHVKAASYADAVSDPHFSRRRAWPMPLLALFLLPTSTSSQTVAVSDLHHH